MVVAFAFAREVLLFRGTFFLFLAIASINNRNQLFAEASDVLTAFNQAKGNFGLHEPRSIDFSVFARVVNNVAGRTGKVPKIDPKEAFDYYADHYHQLVSPDDIPDAVYYAFEDKHRHTTPGHSGSLPDYPPGQDPGR